MKEIFRENLCRVCPKFKGQPLLHVNTVVPYYYFISVSHLESLE